LRRSRTGGSGEGLIPGPPALDNLETLYPQLERLYLDLHQSPELSLPEEKTAAKMAAELRSAGFEVTERVGGWGVVGVLRNGVGPTVMLRTDMDALPVREQTGLPYASKVVHQSESGEHMPVMHACGHDVHMASWIGAANLFARSKDRWRGTLVFVARAVGALQTIVSREVDPFDAAVVAAFTISVMELLGNADR
jgi:metal-dependent amidase/aminoacylase/carboxypeptidase family protein